MLRFAGGEHRDVETDEVVPKDVESLGYWRLLDMGRGVTA